MTHDQAEAMTLGHRVALLKDGRLQQCDAPRVLYEKPANLFVAGFIGSPAMSTCTLAVSNGSVELGGVRVPVEANGCPAVVVGLRPESLELAGSASSSTGTSGARHVPGRCQVGARHCQGS